MGHLLLGDLTLGPLVVDGLELEVAELGTDPGSMVAERFQRRRTRLRSIALHVTPTALETRLEAIRKQLAGLGITQLAARFDDGFLSIRARAAEGLAAADLSFRVVLGAAGPLVRAMVSTIRVHGALPTPGPLIADRILVALFAATDSAGVIERPRVRGLGDLEIDLVGGLLWHLLPPAGWRLPAVGDIELIHVKVHRGGAEVSYGPAGTRVGELGVRPQTHQLAGALDLMHSADSQLRDGHLDDAMRGYRALLAAGGPDQPHVLERILALAAARAPWFFDGLELSRQALGRWPHFAAAHSTLAAITLAQGDAREAARHLTEVAQLASGEGDDLQASLAALAGARLLRVLDPRLATQLYQLALEHDPASAEAADALADRLADEHRWPELVRLVRARAAITVDPQRSVQLRLRLAAVLAQHLDDPVAATLELDGARALAPDDPAVAELTAQLLVQSNPNAAVEAWREVARLAEARGDHRTTSRAWAALGGLVAQGARADVTAVVAWTRALELDPLQADALAGLAGAAAARGAHARAVELLERMRGLGLPQPVAAKHEVELARAYRALGRTDDARASLRRATLVGGETAAEAHAALAELAEESADGDHAAAELDTAIVSLVGLARDDAPSGAASDRLFTRAAELAIVRANLLDRTGASAAASADYQRAHLLASQHAPELARDAARTMLARSGDDAMTARRWIDAVLATRPPPAERAALLVRRADLRRRERTPDLAAALADLHEALQELYDLDDAPLAAAGPPFAAGAVDKRPVASPPSNVDTIALRRQAYTLEAELLAHSGDQRARAQALASLARLAERSRDRAETEAAAAAAWLAVDEPATALPHSARAQDSLEADDLDVPERVRREVLTTLGEAAWRQRSWPEVLRAYNGLLTRHHDDLAPEALYRYRLAIAAERSANPTLASETLQPFLENEELARSATPELRGQALRLAAELAERANDLPRAAAALEQIASLAPDGGRDTNDTTLADAMFRAGELYRRAECPDDAIRCFDGAMRISELHLPALDALETAWRERGDLERVSVILGRKVAATARYPARQKPMLSRLGELQEHLGRPDVALATHQRALEIDSLWRPSLRFVTYHLRDEGQYVAAAGGLAQLAGDLPGDAAAGEVAQLAKERQQAAMLLARLVETADESSLEAIRAVALPVLAAAAIHPSGDHTTGPVVGAALARLRGEQMPRTTPEGAIDHSNEDTQSGKLGNALATALSLRDAAGRARAAGKYDDALATLEAANHVNPGDPSLLRDLVDVAMAAMDHSAAARHLSALAELPNTAGIARGNTLLELADTYYDQLDDLPRGRQAMRAAAEAFGASSRRDSTLRMLAIEAANHLAWEVVINALVAITMDRRSPDDISQLARALVRAGRDADALALVEAANAAGRLDDGGLLFGELHAELQRKGALARSLEERARVAETSEPPNVSAAAELRADARELRGAVGTASSIGPARNSTPTPATHLLGRRRAEPADETAEFAGFVVPRTRTAPGVLAETKFPADRQSGEITIPQLAEDRRAGPIRAVAVDANGEATAELRPSQRFKAVTPPRSAPTTEDVPSVVIRGSQSEQQAALALAMAAADRDTLLAARRSQPDDAGVLLALLAHLGDREPALKREVLEEASRSASGTALAIALDQLAHLAREGHEPMHATALWARAHELDPDYAPVWMPLADALAAADDIETARELYERVAAADDYDDQRRAFAQSRVDALGFDVSIVSGEIRVKATTLPPSASGSLDVTDDLIIDRTSLPPGGYAMLLASARARADEGDVLVAIQAAQGAADAAPTGEHAALELLEELYLETGDVTAASEAIGRQLVDTEDPDQRARLWRRRARIYRDALGRDAEAYRCLKEAQACAPADPEVAYQLRVAAMVRGEWALAASLLYREIAAATSPRDRGALHLELALIYDERLDDDEQAQVNFEQALAFDPSIPAAKLPLARRYEALGRYADAAQLFDAAAATVRAGDRAALHEAAERARAAASASGERTAGSLVAQLERALDEDDLDTANELANRLWRAEPGHPVAYRVLAQELRATGNLAALSELTAVRASQADTSEERASAWLAVARLADELGVDDQAAHAYDLVLVEAPGHLGALDARGNLAYRLHDYATADLVYRDLGAGESMLSDDELNHRRSIIAERLGRDTEALAHAQTAAAAAPGRSDLVRRVQELATRIGDLEVALQAARAVHDLVPLDDDEGQLRSQVGLVELLRQAGDLDGAIAQLDRIRRDHPFHEPSVESLAELHIARGDWTAATRYLYQLVPMAPTPAARADRLYRLGEAVLVHLGDAERADDIFLRASDLEPAHLPTLRRLLDVYWRADDPGQLVEVANELGSRGALSTGMAERSLARALVAAALLGDLPLAQHLANALRDHVAPQVVAALGELGAREGRLELHPATTAVAELARRGVIDIATLRTAAAGTDLAISLSP